MALLYNCHLDKGKFNFKSQLLTKEVAKENQGIRCVGKSINILLV